MKFALMGLLMVIAAQVANAQNYCTEWSRISGLSCVFNGYSVDVWQRQCENPCGWRNYGPHCDLEQFCHSEDPKTLETSCTRWTKESGVTCQNPNTGDWEQKWGRACQNGLVTSWCSDIDPEDSDLNLLK